MIYELYIKNCALIEEESIVFGDGMNILTGETGSGKSIVLEALSLCLGGKYDRTFLRKGCTEGEVSLIFYSDNKDLNSILSELDVDVDADSQILINRRIFEDGKTITKINNRTVRVSDLKRAMSCVVDVHSQHQNQALYDRETHIKFLDMYSKKSVHEALEDYKKNYDKYLNIKREINRLNDNKSPTEIQREIDLIKFQINEIEVANVQEGEYEELKKEMEVLSNSESIRKSLSEVSEILHDENFGIKNMVGKISSILSGISAYDKRLADMEEVFERLSYDIDDVSHDVREYLSNLDFNEGKLFEIMDRLDVLNSLRRKYGSTAEEILAYLDKIRSRLDDIENREEKNKKLAEQLEKAFELVESSADTLTEKRKASAIYLEEEITKELLSLDMKNTKFKVFFNKKEYNEMGCDDIEFYISFNLGEDMKPIYKVASGGEMSRFMLAFKTILSGVDKIETLIFDEIDTGISGIAAQNVGEKMADISKEKQVICITHLPQIAAFADEHLYIEKFTTVDRTYTRVKRLDESGRRDEISRLISGKTITEKTMEHADEMVVSADEIKTSRRKICD